MVGRRRLAHFARLMRLLPPGMRGKARIARAALGRELRARDVEIRDRCGCRLVVPSLSEPIAFHLLIDGDISVREGHHHAECLTAALVAALPEVAVTIHVEPVDEQESWEPEYLRRLGEEPDPPAPPAPADPPQPSETR